MGPVLLDRIRHSLTEMRPTSSDGEQRFLGNLKLRKLKDVVTSDTPGEGGDWDERNEKVCAELILLLDDTSLSQVVRDDQDDGRKAMKILKEHYTNVSKPRVIVLYMELKSLSKSHSETITDYVIGAETAAATLKNNGEDVSDSLLVAMTLKGLPNDYKSFVVVKNQKENVTFEELKKHLWNFEETEKARNSTKSATVSVSDSVMNTDSSSSNKRFRDIIC